VLTVVGERLAWASMFVQSRIQRRWQESTRRGFSTHEYAHRGGRALELDLYLPDDRERPFPLIVWFHGGAWCEGTRADVVPLAMAQVGRGYALASVSYTLTPGATWPTQAHEVKCAVRWLRSNAAELGVDPQRFVAWGMSAGGHLASIVGVTGDRELEGDLGSADQSSSVEGVISWYGPSELSSMGRNSIVDHDEPGSPEAQLVGGPVPESPEEVASASPARYVDGRPLPPFLLVHGTVDPIVPHGQSVLLHDALTSLGGSSTLVDVRLGTHVDLRLNTGACRRAAESFLDEICHPDRG
jgi:acetyl esterase/lipase